MQTDRDNYDTDNNSADSRDMNNDYDEVAVFGMELPDYDVVSGDVAEYTYDARTPLESIVPDEGEEEEEKEEEIPGHDRLVVLSYLALGYDAQNIAYAARMDEDYVRKILDSLDLDD